MERGQALKVLQKLIGPNFGYQIDPRAASPDEREAAKAAMPEAIAERNRVSEQMKKRYQAILAADAEYQSLRAQSKEAGDRVNKLNGVVYHRKITVGTTNQLFFHVKADGDSWEEVIAKVKAEKKAA